MGALLRSGWSTGACILYNVWQARIGSRPVQNPTIYEMPRNVIDFNVTKTVGQKFEVRFSKQDIRNQLRTFRAGLRNRDADRTKTGNRYVRSSLFTLRDLNFRPNPTNTN